MSLKLDSRWSYDVFQMICHRTLMLRNSYTFCWMAVCKKLRPPTFLLHYHKANTKLLLLKEWRRFMKKNQINNVFLGQKTRGNRKRLKQERACFHVPHAATTRSEWRRSLACGGKKPHDLVHGGIWKVPSLLSFGWLLLRTKGARFLFTFSFSFFFFFLLFHFSFCPFLFIFL